ncbi:MAG: fumarylacetoacetate hydrolase family protein [Alphaproteobacteria bacterium]|nr:fumarylacetoacetate hydrolase family protein [Alphaproteobacteria bacterium]
MKICRFDDNKLGVVEGDSVKDVSAVARQLPAVTWPVPHGDLFIAHLDKMIPLMREAAKTAPAIPLAKVKLLSPVANPPRIIAAPLNYALHVQEAADPALNHGVHMPGHEGFATPIDKYGLFLKSQTGLIGAGETVVLQWLDRRNDHEIELGVIIGKGGRNISREDALKHVAGYSIALDMVVRGPEDRSFRKSADTYSVLGPWMVTADEIADPDSLDFSIEVGGEVRQRSNTRDLICDVRDLIVRASNVYALYPGDVIMSGTPDGVSSVKPGGVMHCRFEKIGEMDVRVG